MSTKRRTVAVILGGGVGARVGLSIPKQLIRIAGRPVIEHTIQVFEMSSHIDEIIVMMTPGHLDEIRALVDRAHFQKVTKILPGDATRNKTTYRALQAIEGDCNVLLHDAVRPLVSDDIIARCVGALETHRAVDTAIPSADTVIQVRRDSGVDFIDNVLNRDALRRGQTPQGFHVGVLREAYEAAWRDAAFTATDDCTVVLRYAPDVPVVVVSGEELNMKITEPIDVYISDKLFQLRSRSVSPVTWSHDVYRQRLEGKSLLIFGGTYGIGADIARLATELGALVSIFSRSSTGTHVERRGDITEACESVTRSTSTIDYVVNVAGTLPVGHLAMMSEEAVYAANEVNYLAPIFIAQACYPYLRASKGSLLFFTSSSYTRGRAGYSLYSSAKAATVNLTQALADEWAHDNIRVNCMNPERTATPMRSEAFGEEPAGSLLDPVDVARASIETLLSDLTGHVVDVRKGDPLIPTSGSEVRVATRPHR